MRRITAILLTLLLLLPLGGCRKPSSPPALTTRPPVSAPGTETTPPQTDGESSAPVGTDSPITTEPTPDHPVTLPDVIISEVMPDNEKLVSGHALDYVELYSREDSELSLDGFFLTDDPEKLYDFPLSGKTIASDGYLCITLTEEDKLGLSSAGETVYLTYKGQILSSLTYPESKDGFSFDASGACAYPTPGQPNTFEGYLAYLDSLTLPPLAITEIMSSNKSIADGYDYIEVQNTTSAPLSLKGYTLSDKRKEPNRYIFPAITIDPGQCYVVWCSGDVSLGADHASFKISSDGETVYLSRDGQFADVITVPGNTGTDHSYGRFGTRVGYLDAPTPGSANGSGRVTYLASPAASMKSGIYAEPITVTLSGEGVIHYTLDGTRPTAQSPIYESPLTLSSVTTLRAFCLSDSVSSPLAAYTYIIGADHTLPIVHVAIPSEHLNGEKGILNHIGQDYEYEAMLTLIEGGKEEFSVPFGFRLHGNDSRKGAKQNFQLRFRSSYGVGKLEYPLFENRPFTSYNSLLLKGGSEDFPTAMMRDELATSLVDGTTALYAQAMKPVVLYLGGEYYGIYYLRERYSDDYVASHLEVNEESVDLLYSYGGVQAGSGTAYQKLLADLKTHDMTSEDGFDWLCTQVDIHSLMDWYICRSYMGDKDLANIRYFRSGESDGKWHWCYFDLDWSFWHTTDKPLSSIVKDQSRHALILSVFQSEKGRDAFLSRYAALMDSILNETAIIARTNELEAAIVSEIPADRARWGYSVSRWESAVETLRAYVRDGARDATVLADLKSYFSLSEEEMTRYFGRDHA